MFRQIFSVKENTFFELLYLNMYTSWLQNFCNQNYILCAVWEEGLLNI